MELFAISTASGFLACALSAWLVTLAAVWLQR